MQDYAKYKPNSAIKGFDLLHQLLRLRYAKNMLDTEALAITKSLAEGVKTYDQVVEVSDVIQTWSQSINAPLVCSFWHRYLMAEGYCT
jgi:hypothetical protein